MKKKILAALVTSAALLGSFHAEAAPRFFDDVPANDWSYGAVNDIISTGKVVGYDTKIPSGRVLSRIEMAMIVDAADKNSSVLSADEKETLQKLKQEYFYDIKKLELLNKLDRIDEQTLESSGAAEDFTPEEKSKLKSFADRFSFRGHARVRHDRKKDGNGNWQTVSNHINVWIDSIYKVNDNWKVITGLEYRGPVGNNLDTQPVEANEVQSKHVDPYLTLEGRLKNGLGVKVGKWYEWTPMGFGYDMDSDVTGIQLDFGKKFHTTLTAVKVDLWDNLMISDYLVSRGYEGNADSNFFGVRFDYPVTDKTTVHFGAHSMTTMASRYQDPNHHKRTFYYYAHANHKFDKDWQMNLGIIHSNAKGIPGAINGVTPSKVPGLWLGVQYKQIDINKKGTYDLWVTYRREPGLTWPTVTDWWDYNKQGVRIGADYVLDKNLTFTTWINWCKDIDTHVKSNRYRFQVDAYL